MTDTLARPDARADTAATDPIVCQALAKVFRVRGGEPFTAVAGVDLRVRPGEVFGLLGPNGAGKTTTIGMLTTRVVPTGGRAWVGGLDVTRRAALVKQRIGVVPQTNTLDRSLTVSENLYFHGRYFGWSRADARARAAALLDRFRLGEKRDAKVDALSGGLAQRVMLARAVFHEPSVLFLDEPTTGLDPQARIALWELLGEMNAAGQTVLLTTHYMLEADELCDRVAIMDAGHVLQLGTPAELKKQVNADTVVHLAGDGDLAGLADAAGRVDGVHHAVADTGSVHVHAATADGLLAPLLAAADAARVTVTDVRVDAPTLETVFISLTGKELRE